MQTFLKCSSPESIAQAAALLRQDEVVGIPTETVYGLAASSLSNRAVAKIFAAKGRPQDNPLISHIASLDMLPMVAKDVPQSAYALAAAFWPGPLTMILPRSDIIADAVCAGLPTAAVRMPSHPDALAIIRAADLPLAAPSANLSGSPSPTTAADVFADMNGKVPLIIDGGACAVGVESTVISLTGNTPVLLRPGYITKEQLEKVLGTQVLLSSAILDKLKEGETELKLRAGIAIMRQSKGRDVRNAQRIADGDGSKMGAAMLCICTTLEEFTAVVRRYGAWSPDLVAFFGAHDEHKAGQA